MKNRQVINEYFENYIDTYNHRSRPVWNYEDGCVMLGAQYMYEATGDEKYYECIQKFMDRYIEEDGTIRYYVPTDYNLDKVNNGRALYFLYDKTGKEKYKIALDHIMGQLKTHPRTESGSFWHKQIYPYQIWLDGLYMGQPLYLEYEKRFTGGENYNDITNQFLNARKFLFDEEKQLYYHAYDEKRQMIWADKTTGCSHNFWLRSIGWYLMALIDCYGLMPEECFEHRKTYERLFKEALAGIMQYQDQKTKLFYQLVDMPDLEGNYLETSGSAMIAYSIMKACRLGVLNAEKYRKAGEEILQGLETEQLKQDEDGWHLTGICLVAGLGPKDERDGSVEYYLSEPIVSDEEKGVGVFMMACSEYLKLEKMDA